MLPGRASDGQRVARSLNRAVLGLGRWRPRRPGHPYDQGAVMYGHTSLSEAAVAEGDDDAAPIIPDVGAGTRELVYAVEIEMSVW